MIDLNVAVFILASIPLLSWMMNHSLGNTEASTLSRSIFTYCYPLYLVVSVIQLEIIFNFFAIPLAILIFLGYNNSVSQERV